MCSIRQAQAGDAPAIEALYRQLNTLSEPSVSPERVAELATNNFTYLLVCDDTDKIIATALVCLCQDAMFNNQPFAVIENVVVNSDYQRKGIGKRMMDYIEQLCLQNNCSKIMLQTSTQNRTAQNFYHALGYDPDAKASFIKYRRYFSQQPE